MKVSVTFSLESDDYSDLLSVCEAFSLLRGIQLSFEERAASDSALHFTDEERGCFGRMIANAFTYSDVEFGLEIVRAHRRLLHQTSSLRARMDSDRALHTYEQFVRNIWDDIRAHHMGGVLQEKFGGAYIRAAV